MTAAIRALTFLIVFFSGSTLAAQDSGSSIAARFDDLLAPINKIASDIIFFSVPIAGTDLPIVLVVLGGTAIFLTVYFKFINLRGFGVALRTVRGKYTEADSPGEITHFQALSAALSATVGLGNIGGVAIAIGLGGPGATFWMIVMGLCGMTTKFAECTLGVKYRRITPEGKVRGGAMYYLSDGFAERGLKLFGQILAVFFAIFVIGGAFGAGNMYQSNQAFSQLASTIGIEEAETGRAGFIFGVTLAVVVGLVIIGGIVWIARVTAFLVPFMCGAYMLTALIIIIANLGEVIPALGLIVTSAFSPVAIGGGIVGVLIQGIKRAAFSNEAGLGSAPIAHSAVKTKRPASEGFVALLEPFVDTVVVCTMTALVIVITGTWRVNSEVTTESANLLQAPGSAEVLQPLETGQFVQTRDVEGEFTEVVALVSSDAYEASEVSGWVASENLADRKGVTVTSKAFGSVLPWFPVLLTLAVVLFAFSTMISWSYYGEQGVSYLASPLGETGVKVSVLIYKVVFCFLIVIGAVASLNNVLGISDAMIFAMVIPNLVGLYFLLPVIRKETDSYLAHVKETDGKG
ncbi:MAG: alanine/glycine:cation symporter family protein [Verrucomicrobiota bacterium]